MPNPYPPEHIYVGDSLRISIVYHADFGLWYVTLESCARYGVWYQVSEGVTNEDRGTAIEDLGVRHKLNG